MTRLLERGTERMETQTFRLAGDNRVFFSRGNGNTSSIFLLSRETYEQERFINIVQTSQLSDEVRVKMTAPVWWKVTEEQHYPGQEERKHGLLQIMYRGDGIYLLRKREGPIYLELSQKYRCNTICVIKMKMPRSIQVYRKAFLRKLGYGEEVFRELERGGIVMNDMLTDMRERTGR